MKLSHRANSTLSLLVLASLFLMVFQNCSLRSPSEGGDQLSKALISNSLDANASGGTTVGDPKPSVSYSSYNPSTDPSLPPVTDVRLCVKGVLLYYDRLDETVIEDQRTRIDHNLNAISYDVGQEVRFRPEGTPISNLKLFSGHYTQIDIFVRATGYFNDQYSCSFRWSPFQVTNGFGTFEIDGIYWARRYDLNQNLSSGESIRLPVQKLIDSLQGARSSKDVYDAFDKAEGIWPQTGF